MMQRYESLQVGNRVITRNKAAQMIGIVERIERDTNIPGFWVKWMDGREQWLPFFELEGLDVDIGA
jgi:hypothetical protein